MADSPAEDLAGGLVHSVDRQRWRVALQADGRTRTGDPFITSEVLYQLSYVGGAPARVAPPTQVTAYG